MLQENDIEISLRCQQFECECHMRNEEETESVLLFESRNETAQVRCKKCGGRVNICGLTTKHLKDIPIWVGMSQELSFCCHRYRCVACGRKFTEEIPLQYPGTRITTRAAEWVKSLLRHKMSIRSVQRITGIHWEMIRRIHKKMMT